MAASKFTAPARAQIVAGVGAGASLPDAAHAAGVHPATLKGWITRGRRGEAGYAEFAAEVEAAREAAEAAVPMTREEFRRHLDRAVRAGSVQAMKLWSEIDLRERKLPEPEQPRGKIAELAEHRRMRATS